MKNPSALKIEEYGSEYESEEDEDEDENMRIAI